MARFPHPGAVYSVVFSPDVRLIATGSADNMARLFENATGTEVARLVEREPVRAVAFNPDGQLLAVASGDNVLISPAPPQAIIDYVCAHLPFNLSHEEWKQHLPDEPYRKTCPNLP